MSSTHERSAPSGGPAALAGSVEPARPAPAQVEIRFRLNGRPAAATIPVTMALLELVRERFGLTAAKLGCGEGECGACALLLDGEPVLGCLTPAVDADGREVRTVEGLADAAGLSALQKAFVAEGAIQCGYCTPGMLVSATAVLTEHAAPSAEQVRRGLEGNLCRCTGYVAIVEAVCAAGSARR